MPRLLVKLPGGTKTVPIGDEAVTIGRTSDNSLPLDAEGVSRRHAQILFVGKGYEVVDMGSRNGTKVNGQKVPRALLKNGDVIGVGGIDLVYEDASAGPSGGLELEELDLGGAASSAPVPSSAVPTGLFQSADAAPSGDCVLRFVAGEKQGTDLPLKGPRTTFGRRPSNTVSFNDAAVSGVHCEITREANGFVLRDLGSTNGTLVDGEPVVETFLRHNSRIKIGAQRALFVDPTVADIESTLSADDAAEWGLMKGEIDLSAARGRGGKGALVAAAVVLAAAGAGAWFAMKAAPSGAGVESVKDNRIADFSFEDGVVRWYAPGEEGGASARIAGTRESPRGASGNLSLEVLPSGDAGPGLVEYSTAAAGGGDLTVSPDTAYEISARVGSGRGAVVITWIAAQRPGLVREVASPVVDGSPAWTATKAVVVAPAHATGARVGLAAFGGPATFDDVVFRRVEGGAPPALVSGDLQVRIDASGRAEAVRGGDILLTEGGLAAAADATPESLLGASVASGPAMDGDALAAKAVLPGGGGFTLRVAPEAGGAAFSCAPEGAEGAFTFTCPAGTPRGALTLVLDRTALVLPEQESFTQEGVKKLIVGTASGPRPFALSADPASPGFSFSCRRTPRGLRVRLAPPAGAPAGVDAATVHLSVDLSREDEAARTLLREAEGLARAGRKGAAAAAYQLVTLQYHYLPAFRDPATTALAKLLEEGGARLREARRLADQGKEFGAVPDLETALLGAEGLEREFAEHPLGAEGKELAERVRADLKVVRAQSVEERVEKLFARAVDYEGGRQPMLALLLYEEILRIAPEDDERRGRAEERVKTLREETLAALTALYGARK
jgi:pSer/pThr/pTyr-binding forkhead associated (FHA) protein